MLSGARRGALLGSSKWRGARLKPFFSAGPKPPKLFRRSLPSPSLVSINYESQGTQNPPVLGVASDAPPPGC